MDAYLRRALDAIDRETAALDVGAIARARDGRWSIAQILEHLTLAFSVTTSSVEQAIASGEVRGRRPGWGQRLARVLVVEVGYFPRVQAPERTRPGGHIPPEASVVAIRDALCAMDATLTRALDRFGARAPVANHPYFAGLSVPQWRKFHWRHTVHHMRQIRARSK